MLTRIAHAYSSSLACNRLQERADKWAYYVDRQPAVWVDHVDHWIRWSSLKPDRLLLLRYGTAVRPRMPPTRRLTALPWPTEPRSSETAMKTWPRIQRQSSRRL